MDAAACGKVGACPCSQTLDTLCCIGRSWSYPKRRRFLNALSALCSATTPRHLPATNTSTSSHKKRDDNWVGVCRNRLVPALGSPHTQTPMKALKPVANLHAQAQMATLQPARVPMAALQPARVAGPHAQSPNESSSAGSQSAKPKAQMAALQPARVAGSHAQTPIKL